MRRALFLVTVLMAGAATAHAENAPKATLYKDPDCGCCDGYADHLRSHGSDVTVKPTGDLAAISRKAGVPPKLEGCHTTLVDGYVVEGHVPVNIVRRVLSERPPIAGVSLPGMPAGSPGMGGAKTEPFVIYAVPRDGSTPTVYAKD